MSLIDDSLAIMMKSGGSDVSVVSLSANENGTYTAPSGTAYNPVTVDTGIYTGATAPDNSLGKNGDYYYKLNDLKASVSFKLNAIQNSSTYRLGHVFYVDEPTVIYGFSGYYRRANDNIKFLLLDDQANIIYESVTMTSAADQWNDLIIDAPITIEANKIYWVMMDMPSSYGCYVSYSSSNVWSNSNNIHIEKGVYKYQSSSYTYDNDNIYMATVLIKDSYYNITNEYVKNNNEWILLSSTDKIPTTTLSVTENGTYNAPTGTAYSSVSVDVVDHRLPSGYTSIDYVECPSTGLAGFAIPNYHLTWYNVVESLTMPYQVQDEAAFAGTSGFELYFEQGKAKTWTASSSSKLDCLETRNVSANEQCYHRVVSNYDWPASLFTVGYYKTNNYLFNGRIYYLKIYSTTNLSEGIYVMYYFIPCIQDSTSKVGMYDVINNTFYSSTTGTEFVAPSE